MVPPEIACDESGYEGEKLIGGMTDVFAHASLRLTTTAAAACVARARRHIGSPATTYKANHLLRQRSRPVLEWLLAADGPLTGHAHVYLVDKSYLIVERFTGGPDAAGIYRAGRRTPEPAAWIAFLATANATMRAKEPITVDVLLAAIDTLRRTDPALAGRLDAPAETLRTRPAAAPPTIPALDPLFPAIVRAVAHWGEVTIAHDRQKTFTAERVDVLRTAVPGLAGFRLVDASDDPRVQVADYLAGVARKIASDALAHHGDTMLLDRLRPFVDRWSLWVEPPLRGNPATAAARQPRSGRDPGAVSEQNG